MLLPVIEHGDIYLRGGTVENKVLVIITGRGGLQNEKINGPKLVVPPLKMG